MEHRLRPLYEFLDIDSNECRWNESEIGKRRVATPDVRRVGEEVTEPFLMRELLQWRSGIGDTDEILACLFASDFFQLSIEVLEERIRFCCGAGFTGHDKEGLTHIGPRTHCGNGGRVGAVQDCQVKKASPNPERLPTDLRTKAASTHPQEKRMREPSISKFVNERANFCEMILHEIGSRQPA